MDCAYRADIVVHERVIVELKSVEAVTALHHAQLLTYMKVSRLEIGLLINFNRLGKRVEPLFVVNFNYPTASVALLSATR